MRVLWCWVVKSPWEYFWACYSPSSVSSSLWFKGKYNFKVTFCPGRGMFTKTEFQALHPRIRRCSGNPRSLSSCSVAEKWGGPSGEMKILLYSVKFFAACHNLNHPTGRFSVAYFNHSNVLSGLADTFFKKRQFLSRKHIRSLFCRWRPPLTTGLS